MPHIPLEIDTMRIPTIAALPAIVLATITACSGGGEAAGAAKPDSRTMEGGRSGYVRIAELEMYYEIHGEGEPLVLLHGGGSTIGTTFGRVLPGFAAGRRVVAVETQGHGHTADLDRPLSFEQDADDVAALLQQLGIARADVFGFSNGGNVALQLAIRHPAIVRKLVLASAFVANDGLLPEVRGSFDRASVDDMPDALRAAYLEAAPDPGRLPVLVDKLMHRLTSFVDIPESDLRGIAAPTLVMIADADIVTPEHAVHMTRLIPDARLAIFPDADHGSYLGEVTATRACRYCAHTVVAMVEEFLGASAAR